MRHIYVYACMHVYMYAFMYAHVDTAGELGDACSQMVAGSWREKALQKRELDKASVAKDVLTVMQAPERIATSIEQHKYVAAAVHLLSARERFQALKRSSSPAVNQWLAGKNLKPQPCRSICYRHGCVADF